MMIELRTTDEAWAADRPAGRDGRVVVEVAHLEPVTFAGRSMVRTHLTDPPADYGNPNVMVPVEWQVAP